LKRFYVILFAVMISFPLFSEAAKPRVGVLDFRANNISRSDADAINDVFVSELVTAGYYDVVDRKNIQTLLKEMEFQLGEQADSEYAVKVGKILSLQYVMYGSVSKLGRSYILTVYLINVETAKIIDSAQKKFYTIEQSYSAVKEVISKLGGGKSGREDGKSDFGGANTAIAKKTSGRKLLDRVKGKISIEVGGGGVVGGYESGLEIESVGSYMFTDRWGAGLGVMLGIGEFGLHFGMNFNVYYRFTDFLRMSLGLRGFPNYTNSFGGPSVGVYFGKMYGRISMDIVDAIGLGLDFGYRFDL